MTRRLSSPWIPLVLLLLAAVSARAQQTQPSSGSPERATPTAFDASKSEEKAVKVADRLVDALGGKAAWDKLPLLVFTFTVEKEGKVVAARKHFWDKAAGRHRLEGATKDGKKYVVLTDLKAHKGTAYLGGQKLEGDEAQKYLEQAYALFINDTYWLCMPFKVKDPGVVLTYAGEEEADGVKYQKIKLAFEGVGLTPRDVYWAYVNADTGKMDRWSFVLNGRKDAPTVAVWKGWRQHGGVWLSDEKDIIGGGQRILFPDLSAPPSLPEAVFSTPEGVLASEIPPEK